MTVSTLHGCPPDEIEAIASYLIREKGLNTFVKCNPTILGYDFARERLNKLGYDYIAFDEHHFNEDLQYADAVPMFRRLMQLAKDNGVEFGLKLSNTFPVDVKANELPSEEMYMSGRALYPLTIEMAARFSREFEGRLRLSLLRRGGLFQYCASCTRPAFGPYPCNHNIEAGRIFPLQAAWRAVRRRIKSAPTRA